MNNLRHDKELINLIISSIKKGNELVYDHLYNMVNIGMITLSEFVEIIKQTK